MRLWGWIELIDNENECIISAKNGDQNAINKLFLDKNPMITQIAKKYYIVGGDLDDLIQEGRFGLFKALNIYDFARHDNFTIFARKIIEREIISAIRKENTGKNLALDESVFVSAEDEEILHSNSNPEQDFIWSESFKEIKEKMFSKLSDFESQVFDYYLQDYSYLDIARELDKSPKTIDNALTRIKLKLTSIKEDLWVIRHCIENIGHKVLMRLWGRNI